MDDARDTYIATLRQERVSLDTLREFLRERLGPQVAEDAIALEKIGIAILEITAAQADLLRADPAVLEVVNDCVYQMDASFMGPAPGATPPQPLDSLNLSMIRVPEVWGISTGRGIKVAIVDSGIEGDPIELPVQGGISFVPGEEWWQDGFGHGTRVAGIAGARGGRLTGVAPECSLYAVKVIDKKGSWRLCWVVEAMYWAAEHGMQVANLSIGQGGLDANAPCDVKYGRASSFLRDQGCFATAAAGNSGLLPGSERVREPARCPAVVAVGAVNEEGRRRDISSYGPPSLPRDRGVELMAPGWKIATTAPNGGVGTLAATSAACPHVAGAAALLAASEVMTPETIRARLRSGAQEMGGVEHSEKCGFGLLDCQASMEAPAKRPGRFTALVRRLLSPGAGPTGV